MKRAEQDSNRGLVEVTFFRDQNPYRKGRARVLPQIAKLVVESGVGEFAGLPPPVPLPEKRGLLKVRRA